MANRINFFYSFQRETNVDGQVIDQKTIDFHAFIRPAHVTNRNSGKFAS